MTPSLLHNLIGMVLVHLDGTEYVVHYVSEDSRRTGLKYFNNSVGSYMCSQEFIDSYLPFLSFYKDDEDNTLYPLSDIENILDF